MEEAEAAAAVVVVEAEGVEEVEVAAGSRAVP